ncbi:AraC family transcriptional regulator [Burkholderia metallica]|uniref:AraC family transcriptional regulator n=1 Tax=Burkholderia metallica TaxID=488729 RepID=UPI000D1B841E|nr:AraC family transcriptional regulator [Burkholderia metallica]
MSGKPKPQRAPLCRAGQFGPLLRALDAVGADCDGLLRRYRVSRRMLADPYHILPVRTYIEMFEKAAVLLNESSLGLRLGKELQLPEMGPVGLVYLSSATLRIGMRKFSAAIESWQGATSMELSLKHDPPMWLYQINDPSIWPRVQDTEFSVSAMCNMIRLVRGPNWTPLEIHFEHAPPTDTKPFNRMFRCAVRFNQQTNAVFLSSKDLDAPIQSADIHMAVMMERHAADLISRNVIPHTLVEQVKDLISRRLSREKLIVGDIAKDLGLSQRSLQRHLSDAGTSVREIVREIRQKNVQALAGKEGISRGALARAVGYADSSVLWRAVKSWTEDKSPTAPLARTSKRRR